MRARGWRSRIDFLSRGFKLHVLKLALELAIMRGVALQRMFVTPASQLPVKLLLAIAGGAWRPMLQTLRMNPAIIWRMLQVAAVIVRDAVLRRLLPSF